MKPNHFCDQLEAFYDGELPQTERRAMSEHVKSCRDCREGLAGLRALEGILRPQLEQADITEAVMDRVMELVRARPRSALSFLDGWWKVPAFALASFAVYALCVETGILPGGRSQLAAAISAYRSSQKISTMLYGGQKADNEQLLALLLEGDE
jgi:anti-sigma factor RsiW